VARGKRAGNAFGLGVLSRRRCSASCRKSASGCSTNRSRRPRWPGGVGGGGRSASSMSGDQPATRVPPAPVFTSELDVWSARP
jgi:hypothetical protein